MPKIPFCGFPEASQQHCRFILFTEPVRCTKHPPLAVFYTGASTRTEGAQPTGFMVIAVVPPTGLLGKREIERERERAREGETGVLPSAFIPRCTRLRRDTHTHKQQSRKALSAPGISRIGTGTKRRKIFRDRSVRLKRERGVRVAVLLASGPWMCVWGPARAHTSKHTAAVLAAWLAIARCLAWAQHGAARRHIADWVQLNQSPGDFSPPVHSRDSCRSRPPLVNQRNYVRLLLHGCIWSSYSCSVFPGVDIRIRQVRRYFELLKDFLWKLGLVDWPVLYIGYIVMQLSIGASDPLLF